MHMKKTPHKPELQDFSTIDQVENAARKDPIRMLAIERIIELEKELKSYGYKARCGIEVEFFVNDDEDKPVAIPKKKLQDVKAALMESRYVEDLREENVQRSWSQPFVFSGIGLSIGLATAAITQDAATILIGLGAGVTGAAVHSSGYVSTGMARRLLKAGQYEINLGDRIATENDDAQHRLGPLKASIATDYFQKKLSSLLEDTGQVDYRAKPRKDKITSGMHINMSLTDSEGHNAFASPSGGESKLMKNAIAHLVEAQKEGAVTFLPSENSHQRVLDGLSSPNSIGKQYNKMAVSKRILPSSSADSRHASWIGHLSAAMNGTKINKSGNRAENRLPGADADPYLAIAATLGAIVQSVRETVKEEKNTKLKRHKVPQNLEESVTAFNQSKKMRDILGDALYEAVAQQYQEQSTDVQR